MPPFIFLFYNAKKKGRIIAYIYLKFKIIKKDSTNDIIHKRIYDLKG